MLKESEIHCPVLLKPAIDLLGVKPGGVYLDATVGAGGHSAEILKRKGRVVGLDLDPLMLKFAKARLQKSCPNGPWQLKVANFTRMEAVLKNLSISKVEGVFFDLGLSRYHYLRSNRGFSFNDQQELDLRLGSKGMKAGELLKEASLSQLTEVLAYYAQEPLAGEISRAIIKERKGKKLTAARLARLIEEIYFLKGRGKSKIHPATKTFLALRIWVNREEENLKKGLAGAGRILKPEGRLVVISFHSGEDRIVKTIFKNWKKEKRGKILTPRPLYPDKEEVKNNPLSRSAVLRAFEKRKK